jgi:hypothetical protein
LIAAAVRVLPAVALPLPQAVGRVLAEDVRAPMPLPRFDNAAMDGYAIRTAEVAAANPDAPTALWSVAPSSAGQATPPELAVGCACPVGTGAPLPTGADAVIMLEHAIEHNGKVLVSRPVDRGQHVRRRGEDVAAGSELLHARSSRRGRLWRPPRVASPSPTTRCSTPWVPPCRPCSPTPAARRRPWARSTTTPAYSPVVRSAEGGAEHPPERVSHNRGGGANGQLAQPPAHQRTADQHSNGRTGGEQRRPTRTAAVVMAVRQSPPLLSQNRPRSQWVVARFRTDGESAVEVVDAVLGTVARGARRAVGAVAARRVAAADCPPDGQARPLDTAKCGLVLLVMVGLVGRRDVEQARYDEALGHRPRSVRPG